MKVDLHELLDHNGYTIGSVKNIRKKTVKEIIAETTRDRLEEVVKQSTSFLRVLESITGKPRNTAEYKALFIEACDYWGIDYSHLINNKSGRRQRRKIRKSFDYGMTAEDVISEFLCENPVQRLSWPTIAKLINKYDILPQQCSECGISAKWNGKPLTLHIDHINGVNTDNRLENLRRLCPNCHSQTDTFCGKNKINKPLTHLLDAQKV